MAGTSFVNNEEMLSVFKEMNEEEFLTAFNVSHEDYEATALALSQSGNAPDRALAAKKGYELETLINDTDPEVRAAVAEQGYRPDILAKDPVSFVRLCVAEQGFELDTLVNDENPYIRATVAIQNYGLKQLSEDKDPNVRNLAEKMQNNLLSDYLAEAESSKHLTSVIEKVFNEHQSDQDKIARINGVDISFVPSFDQEPILAKDDKIIAKYEKRIHNEHTEDER